jgi:hypothetical protein
LAASPRLMRDDLATKTRGWRGKNGPPQVRRPAMAWLAVHPQAPQSPNAGPVLRGRASRRPAAVRPGEFCVQSAPILSLRRKGGLNSRHMDHQSRLCRSTRKRIRGYCGYRQLVREDVGPRIRAAVEQQAWARERISGRARRDTGIAPIKQRSQPRGPLRRAGHQERTIVHRPAAARSHAVRDPDAARGSRRSAPRPRRWRRTISRLSRRDWRPVACGGTQRERSQAASDPCAWLRTCCNAYKKLQHRQKEEEHQ